MQQTIQKASVDDDTSGPPWVLRPHSISAALVLRVRPLGTWMHSSTDSAHKSQTHTKKTGELSP
eukprot:2225-Heterococcus_DN1.PRE.2